MEVWKYNSSKEEGYRRVNQIFERKLQFRNMCVKEICSFWKEESAERRHFVIRALLR